jgi:hypothetical protein
MVADCFEPGSEYASNLLPQMTLSWRETEHRVGTITLQPRNQVR